MWACRLNDGESHEAIVDALLNAGADVDLKNNDGDAAFHIACLESFTKNAHLMKQNPNSHIIHALEKRGADVKASNGVGNVLHQVYVVNVANVVYVANVVNETDLQKDAPTYRHSRI